jgi:hypothetical protein
VVGGQDVLVRHDVGRGIEACELGEVPPAHGQTDGVEVVPEEGDRQGVGRAEEARPELGRSGG